MQNKRTRRAFINKMSKATMATTVGLGAIGSFLESCGATKKSKQSTNNTTGKIASPWLPTYEQAPLPYAYDALEPIIDKETMNIHYTKHAAAYAKNLADALADEIKYTPKPNIGQLLSGISNYTVKMRNNAGGHYNHEFFWQLMKPNGEKLPTGNLLAAINRDFGSYEQFRKAFEDAAKARFGSGWAWLILNRNGKLQVTSTSNQDNPLMDVAEMQGTPLVALDVWEHAYYLKYQNKRADYITNWWNILNWTVVKQHYDSAT
jgi:superoxide dismutase, Fe-Mn family